MAYTKIIQSGEYTEIYNYEKDHVIQKHQIGTRNNRKKSVSTKKHKRTSSSIQRAKAAFFRLVQSNLERDRLPLLLTFTVLQNTRIEDAYDFFQRFAKKVRRFYGTFNYISVPEWQPDSGKIHFHCLVFSDLPQWNERMERNFQRLYLRGYVDSMRAYNSSSRIAGYMAKYMVKALEDDRLGNRRAYSSSHTIKRPLQKGSNSLNEYTDMILSTQDTLVEIKNYETMYLGRCVYQRYKKS